MDWTDTYITEFKTAYENCTHSLYLKDNPKYNYITKPIIIFDDVVEYYYRIRNRSGAIDLIYNNKEDQVLISYNSIEDMVADGWKLD